MLKINFINFKIYILIFLILFSIFNFNNNLKKSSNKNIINNQILSSNKNYTLKKLINNQFSSSNKNYTLKKLIKSKIPSNDKNNIFRKKINNQILSNDKSITLNNLINKLLLEFNKTEQNSIIFSDYFYSKYCNDFNAYFIFKYYQQKNISNPYYIINVESYLYNTLLKRNETEHLILYNSSENLWSTLYKYLLHTKIIIQSYCLYEFHILVNKLPYLKYLKINHGVRYFKTKIGLMDLIDLNVTKRNIITSSPFEYELFIKFFNYSDSYIHKAGIARYDRFKDIKKNHSEKDCILITFTYRKYNNTFYLKSLYKKNIERLLSDEELISFLKSKNIDIIYISHHQELYLNRTFNLTNYKYIKYMGQNKLSHYIEHCSLLVTDFSSIAFDFMFQNKLVLFYLVDVDDTLEFEEKIYMNNTKNIIYFGNAFKDKKMIVNKIKFYVNENFKLNYELKKKYEKVFYYKNNITEKIVDIINNIIKK